MRVFLTILLLVILAYAGYLSVGWVHTQYALIPTAEQPRIGLIAVLVTVAVFLLTGAIRSGARELAQQGLLVQRYRVYRMVLDTLQQDRVPPALQLKADQGLALLGSRAVLQAFRILREEVAAQGVGSPLAAELMRKLTVAMRKDLGQSTFDILTESRALRSNRNVSSISTNEKVVHGPGMYDEAK